LVQGTPSLDHHQAHAATSDHTPATVIPGLVPGIHWALSLRVAMREHGHAPNSMKSRLVLSNVRWPRARATTLANGAQWLAGTYARP
jgi:hypothetical protein